MERRRGADTRRRIIIMVFFCALAIPLFAVGGCGKQLARMEDNQIKLQALVAANARELATISSQLDAGQGRINESIRTLDGDTRQVAADIAVVRDQQGQFRAAMAADHEGLHRRIAGVQDNQRSLQGSVAHVSEVTQRTAADLTALAREHAALQQTVGTHQQEITGCLRAVADGQQRIVTGIGVLHEANKELAANIDAKHGLLYAALQNSDKQATERFTALAAGQGRLSADVANVHTQIGKMNTDLVAAHSSLKEYVTAGQQALTTQIDGLATRQQQLQTSLDTLGAKSEQTAADLADTRSSLQGTLQASQEALTGQIDGLAADVTTVHTQLNTLTEDLVAGRSSLQEQLAAGQQALTTRIAGLSDGQQQLQTAVDTLGAKADQTAADLADTRASLQDTLRISREVLTGQLAASLQNQQALQSDVRDLGAKADQLAEDIGAVSGAQTALHAAVRTHQDAVVAALAGLAGGQETLRSGLEKLDGKAERAAGDLASLAAQQQSLSQAVRTNHDSLVPKLAEVAATTAQTARDVTALNNGQAALQQSIQAGATALTARAAELQQSLKAHSDKTDQQAASMADMQEQMRTSLDTLAATAGQTNLDVIAMATRQEALRAALASHNETLDVRMAQFANHQQQMQSSLDTVTATTSQAALDILGLTQRQDTLQATLQDQKEALGTQMAQLADGQQQMRSSLDTVTATTGQAALDILGLTQRQDTLQATLQDQKEALGTQMAQLADGQQQMRSSLDTVTATTGQAALDILGLTQRQDTLQASLQDQKEALGTQMAQLADGQQQMQSSLDTVTATTGQAALDILGLTQRQDTLQAALQDQKEALGTQMAQLADGQQQMRSSLDTVTATTGQTALDILGVAQRQEAVQGTLKSHDETLGAQMARLADHQQQMQTSLDTVTATTGQAALDTLALNNGQSRLGEAVQAGRQEMADKLADMTQDQQKWSERLDAAQARVTTIGESVAVLEQRVAKLQDFLQASLQSTAALLEATTQQRLQFETKVSQDLQAVVNSLTQLRQTQTALQEQIAQVQKSTQGQADSLRSVLQQIKTSPNATDRARDRTADVEDIIGARPAPAAPAEVQVSHAAPVPAAPPAPQAAE